MGGIAVTLFVCEGVAVCVCMSRLGCDLPLCVCECVLG